MKKFSFSPLVPLMLMAVPLFAFQEPAKTKESEENLKAERIKLLKSEGKRQVEEGQVEKAAEVYRQLKEMGLEQADREQVAKEALRSAKQVQPGKDEKPTAERMVATEQLYRLAIDQGTDTQRVSARNDLGVFYLQSGRAAEAVETLRQIDPNQLPAEQRFIYQYNTARALELEGNGAQAYDLYVDAIQSNPRFTRAADRAYQTLFQLEPAEGIQKAVGLTSILMEQKQNAVAESNLLAAFRRWGDRVEVKRLLPLMLRQEVSLGRDLETLAESALGQWREIAERSPQLRPALTDLANAYSGDLSHLLVKRNSVEVFREWVYELGQGREFAVLLKNIGDRYSFKDRKVQAMSRYQAAWELDPDNTEAALYCANVLQDSPELDPNGWILRGLIDTIFVQKGNDYRMGDWENILKKHLLLSKIFERRNQWDPRSNPQTVLFQLHAALRAENNLREQDPEVAPSPGLRHSLGSAYLRLRQLEPGIDHELEAVRAYIQIGNPDAGWPILRPLERYKARFNREQRALFDRLTAYYRERR